MPHSQDLAVVRNVPEGKLTFSLTIRNLDKQINMCRSADEDMADFMQRFTANVTKVIEKRNKRTKTESPATMVDIAFTKDGKKVEFQGQTATEFFKQPDLKLDLMESVYDIALNPPMIQKGRFSETILTGFFFYPHRLEYESAAPNKTVFEWYVSPQYAPFDNNARKQFELARTTWTKHSEGFFFKPQDCDEHRYVRVVCRPHNDNGEEGLPYEIISQYPVSAGPRNCPFETRNFKADNGPNDFRILTYNLLADLYADSDYSRTILHPQCPAYALDISYRKLLILKELLGYDADIMCLQEVDQKIFDHDLKPILSTYGYDGEFDLKGGKVSEGLACFWNTEKFKLVDTQRFIISDSILSNHSMVEMLEANSMLKESFAKRTTALKVVVLESVLNPKRRLIVGITHLYFRPDADHIRLLQASLCLDHLQEISDQFKASHPDFDYSVILAGDFNSTPPFGVLEFMRKGFISDEHPDWSSCKGEEVKGVSVHHKFKLDSACGTPKYTTYTKAFSDCIDYIFYPTEKMTVKNVLPFPLEEELEQCQGIPHINFPSDHISCVADLSWK